MRTQVRWTGEVRSGAGGASKAFAYANGRRCKEIAEVIGAMPYPGSLNVHLTEPFDWTLPHRVAWVLDVVERGKGLDVEWAHRKARLYPVCVNVGEGGPNLDAWVFRFDGERYADSFVELLAPCRLRDHLQGDSVILWHVEPEDG